MVTLAAMIHGIPFEQIVPETINGLSLRLEEIEEVFHEMNAISLAERMQRYRLEPERAGVILAGSLIVIRIMRRLKARTLLVSMSDLLEGILFDFWKESNMIEKILSLPTHLMISFWFRHTRRYCPVMWM